MRATATQALANVTTHEIVESVTDPQIDAWYDRKGAEISDKCAWQFAHSVTVGSKQWNLQEEWSNAAAACVQQ